MINLKNPYLSAGRSLHERDALLHEFRAFMHNLIKDSIESNTVVHDFNKSLHSYSKNIYDLVEELHDFDKSTCEINRFMYGFSQFIINRAKFRMKTQMVIYEQTKSSHILIMFIHGYYKVKRDKISVKRDKSSVSNGYSMFTHGLMKAIAE